MIENHFSFLELIPRKLRNQLGDNQGLLKVLSNINWLSIGIICRNIVGILISAWIARYLGPDNFGILNYTIAFVALFSNLSTLGLDDISIRNFVSNPDLKNSYKGSVFLMKFIGSFLMFIVCSVAIYFFNKGNQNLNYFVPILAAGYIFKSFDVIDLWFQSRVKSKFSVYASLLSFLIVTSIRVVLIITGKPLISFVFTYTIDFLLNSLFLLLFYKKEKEGKLFDWRVEISVIKGLLKDSWPLILSGFATMIYMKIDQIMIGEILGDMELGIYASAVKLSEAWYFIPTVVTSSVFPAILNAKRKDINLYNKRLQTLYDFFMWFTIIFSIIISCLSSQIINLFYGKEYINAGPVLAIHIWAGFAVFLGIASGKYLIAENMTKFSFIRTVVGAVVNVVSNIILLPRIGIIGAAVSTLLSYTASTFSVLFIPETRDLGKNLLKSFNIFRIIKDLWK